MHSDFAILPRVELAPLLARQRHGAFSQFIRSERDGCRDHYRTPAAAEFTGRSMLAASPCASSGIGAASVQGNTDAAGCMAQPAARRGMRADG
jgi:hypothetical protein